MDKTKEFIEKAKRIQKVVYGYDKTVYVKSSSKVIITCLKHGDFLQNASSHLLGCGCPLCKCDTIRESKKSSIAYIEKLILERQGTKYTYPDLDSYINMHTKMRIICPYHGEFLQSFANHLSAQKGCSKCAKNGFKVHKPAYLYIFSSPALTKIGITNNAPEYRLKVISQSAGIDFKIHKTFYFKNGQDAIDIETKVLNALSKYYTSPEFVFKGSTECFYDVNMEHLESIIYSQHENSSIAVLNNKVK